MRTYVLFFLLIVSFAKVITKMVATCSKIDFPIIMTLQTNLYENETDKAAAVECLDSLFLSVEEISYRNKQLLLHRLFWTLLESRGRRLQTKWHMKMQWDWQTKSRCVPEMYRNLEMSRNVKRSISRSTPEFPETKTVSHHSNFKFWIFSYVEMRNVLTLIISMTTPPTLKKLSSWPRENTIP